LRILARNILEAVSQLDRVSPYLNSDAEVGSIRLLSVYVLIRVVLICFVVCCLWKKVSSEERLFVFCSGAGLFLQVLFSLNEAVALRGSELFGLFDIMVFMIPLRYLRSMPACSAYVLFLIAIGAKFYTSALALVGPYSWILG
jgi:hypothetical protein